MSRFSPADLPGLTGAVPAAKAGAKIAGVATTPRPRARYTLGRDAAFTIPLARFLPARLMDGILAMSHRSRNPKPASTPAPESTGSPS
ncbi:hypothetical protein [Streptomyces sp. NPDC058665]|uniref:hypothetical protein n=1 Tax=Streptomyces sp. NPDC058665 TaxID=3346586 RepID=UPI00364830C3